MRLHHEKVTQMPSVERWENEPSHNKLKKYLSSLFLKFTVPITLLNETYRVSPWHDAKSAKRG